MKGESIATFDFPVVSFPYPDFNMSFKVILNCFYSQLVFILDLLPYVRILVDFRSILTCFSLGWYIEIYHILNYWILFTNSC